MSRGYDPFQRQIGTRSHPTRQMNIQSSVPTLEDYQALLKAHQELQSQYANQSKTLEQKAQEGQIKDEMLHKQGKELKDVEAELIWTKAALQQTQEKLDEQKPEDDDGQSWHERYMRLQAEMENLRKRWEQRHRNDVVEARHRILLDMLPLADHLDMALIYASTIESGGDKGFIGNIEATRRAFLDTLKGYGIEKIEAEGQPFDPNLHEAISQIETDDVPPDHVAHIIQSGYKERDKLLRPVRVMVSKAKEIVDETTQEVQAVDVSTGEGSATDVADDATDVIDTTAKVLDEKVEPVVDTATGS